MGLRNRKRRCWRRAQRNFPHFSGEQLECITEYHHHRHGLEHSDRDTPNQSDRPRRRPYHWIGHLHLFRVNPKFESSQQSAHHALYRSDIPHGLCRTGILLPQIRGHHGQHACGHRYEQGNKHQQLVGRLFSDPRPNPFEPDRSLDQSVC
ncbi:MAG: Uncharacterised protein [Flavobacteriia bacterium]|nr:MAG: Uncharacterised protein [Flavobacteriia bacterium]